MLNNDPLFLLQANVNFSYDTKKRVTDLGDLHSIRDTITQSRWLQFTIRFTFEMDKCIAIQPSYYIKLSVTICKLG